MLLLTVLAYMPFLGVALTAQWSDRHDIMRWITFGLLLLLDAAIGLGAILAIVSALLVDANGSALAALPGGAEPDPLTFGMGLLATAIVAPICLLRPVRRLLARLIPIDAASGVHATALVLAVFMVGLTLSQVALIGGLETIAAGGQMRFLDLWAPLLPIGLFALVGVGYIVRRNWAATRRRLGLDPLTWRQAGLAAALAVGIVALYYGIDWIWRTVAPENYALIEGVGDVLFGGVTAPWQGIVLSLTAAVMEELLFRGAVQPRFGLLLTSLLFTVSHVQYGLTPAALEILIAALVLGWLRRRHSTSASMLLHFLYDVLALVIFPLLP
jgi:membrane protease YdiL (CAAX protease family)